MKSVVVGVHLRRDDIEPVAAAIPVGEIFLSGVEVPDDRPLGDRELLLQVAGARARLLERATFIAIRYGFAVRDAHEAEARCAPRLSRWQELLTAHRQEVEMTLKVAASSPRPRPDRHAFASGAGYLRALHDSTRAVQVDSRFREAVGASLVPFSSQHRWVPRDNASSELVMLVRRSDISAFNQAGERLRGTFTDVPFLLSGPWPLEVFAGDDHQ